MNISIPMWCENSKSHILGRKYQSSLCVREGVRGAVRCGFGSFLASHFACSLAKTIIAQHLIFAVTYVVRCGLKFSQNYNRTAYHFCGHIYGASVRCIKCGLNDLKFVYFSNFGLFLPNAKLIFPFVLVQVLNYWASFSLFWVGFPNQHLLGLSNYFFLLKTRVIKLLIIYLILNIIKYTNI